MLALVLDMVVLVNLAVLVNLVVVVCYSMPGFGMGYSCASFVELKIIDVMYIY